MVREGCITEEAEQGRQLRLFRRGKDLCGIVIGGVSRSAKSS